jgi:catechol 2,3-dioxygenase-like lactoylglutathione lyase family enzyme
MRIYITSVLVDDQEKALRFYTDVLGFVKKTDIPVGEARWLTVVSPDDPQGTPSSSGSVPSASGSPRSRSRWAL